MRHSPLHNRTLRGGLLREELPHGDRELKLNLESPEGTLKLLPIRFNLPRPKTLKVEGASIDGNKLAVQFPKGTGYTNQQVTIHW